MSSDTAPSKSFRIEGSGAMLAALARATELALQSARKTPYRKGAGIVTHGGVAIEVNATTTHSELKYMISSIEYAANSGKVDARSTHFPLHTGLRFSKNAPIPSCVSNAIAF